MVWASIITWIWIELWPSTLKDRSSCREIRICLQAQITHYSSWAKKLGEVRYGTLVHYFFPLVGSDMNQFRVGRGVRGWGVEVLALAASCQKQRFPHSQYISGFVQASSPGPIFLAQVAQLSFRTVIAVRDFFTLPMF